MDWTPGVASSALSTLILAAALLTARAFAVRYVRRQEWSSPQMGRRWIIQIRTALLLLMSIGLVFIWADELRAAAISLVALAAAVVIATKELIMCISGSLVRTSGRSFSIGDRVVIDGVRGDVIDHTVLTTTLLEVGPGHSRSGRTVVIPNSALLNGAVINETGGHPYVLHTFSVAVGLDGWSRTERVLIDAARRVAAPHVAPAREQMDRIARENSLSLPSVEPQVVFDAPAAGELLMTVRVPCPARERGRVEQAILRDWLATIADDASPTGEGQEPDRAVRAPGRPSRPGDS